MKGKKLGKNEFFDINRFPKGAGLILFPISISNIDTKQKPLNCLKQVEWLNEKIVLPKVGLNFIYGDFLYLNSDEKASKLKEKFMHQVSKHRNSVGHLILKAHRTFQIQDAFNYLSWNNLYLIYSKFPSVLDKIKKFYYEDRTFKKYLKEDAKFFKRRLNKNQINFFLEEHLACYLLITNKLVMPNEFLKGNQKWILWSYPGVPPKALVYLCQKDPLNLNQKERKFYGQYNLENKKFYGFNEIDLETWNYE